MKRKYHGLISILIIVAVLIPATIYAVYFVQVPVKGDTVRLREMPTEFLVPDTAVMKEISRLEDKMTALANPIKLESMSDQPIRFWQYSDQQYPNYKPINSEGEKIDIQTAHALTFTFTSGEKRFCILDGSFYTQGTELPSGEKILKIESGKVLVRKGELTTWISIPETAEWGKIQ